MKITFSSYSACVRVYYTVFLLVVPNISTLCVWYYREEEGSRSLAFLWNMTTTKYIQYFNIFKTPVLFLIFADIFVFFVVVFQNDMSGRLFSFSLCPSYALLPTLPTTLYTLHIRFSRHVCECTLFCYANLSAYVQFKSVYQTNPSEHFVI